jgi:hypothetical protein
MIDDNNRISVAELLSLQRPLQLRVIQQRHSVGGTACRAGQGYRVPAFQPAYLSGFCVFKASAMTDSRSPRDQAS